MTKGIRNGLSNTFESLYTVTESSASGLGDVHERAPLVERNGNEQPSAKQSDASNNHGLGLDRKLQSFPKKHDIMVAVETGLFGKLVPDENTAVPTGDGVRWKQNRNNGNFKVMKYMARVQT